ncbi:MAG: aminodeoxychorismate synthase component I [Thiotrichales bacterium]|nr:aminodeoxychorismate synthase component I [Thiotrichales bacterium]
MKQKLTELPYFRDSAGLFSVIAAEPWSIFLDSGFPYQDLGRYDIIAARPWVTLVTRGQETRVTERNAEYASTDDPFDLVKSYLGPQVRNLTGLPFCGGAMGYFAYDLGRRIEKLPETSSRDLDVPDMAIGIYDWAVIVDHHLRRSWLCSMGNDEQTLNQWSALQQIFRDAAAADDRVPEINSDINSNFDKEHYARAFHRVKQYIRSGDCYQVNLAQRFDVSIATDPWSLYRNLRQLNPAPFSAYMNLDECAVLSSSPERFLKVADGHVETKPIKGTRRRSSFAFEDSELARELLESEKDRAENLMIVDLLRNDLGKNCRTGSIAVPKLYALESYATVHHLVSTVTGRLARDRHALDLLRGCFPGGSITGAPKCRAMEIIEELEPHRRTVYCGSIGYIGCDGNMDTSIAIRTLVQIRDHVYYWAGGGIVADSKMAAEYQECFDKAAAMLKLLDQKSFRNVVS